MPFLMSALNALTLEEISGFVWGPATLILIAGTGLYLMLGLKLMPLRRLGFALNAMLASMTSDKGATQSGDGEVNAFQGLMTALAATIGTGNVAGVAAAIGAGGPGAVFWMWLAALLGIATKYFECMLAGFGIGNGVQSLEMARVLSSYGIPDCRRNSTHWPSGRCCSSPNGWDLHP